MQLLKTKSGKINLHIWREGSAFEWIQKYNKIEEWNNIRFSVMPSSNDKNITTLDVRKGLPYEDNSFDAVYANRMMEHFTVDENQFFIKEL